MMDGPNGISKVVGIIDVSCDLVSNSTSQERIGNKDHPGVFLPDEIISSY